MAVRAIFVGFMAYLLAVAKPVVAFCHRFFLSVSDRTNNILDILVRTDISNIFVYWSNITHLKFFSRGTPSSVSPLKFDPGKESMWCQFCMDFVPVEGDHLCDHGYDRRGVKCLGSGTSIVRQCGDQLSIIS